MIPLGPEQRDDNRVPLLLILLALAATLHAAGSDWESVRASFDILAAAIALARTPL